MYFQAAPSLTGLRKSKAEQRTASLDSKVTLVNSHGMSLNEVMARFTFPNDSFHITGDCITGKGEDCDRFDKYVWLTNAETMPSFEFGFSIKASRTTPRPLKSTGNGILSPAATGQIREAS